MFRARALVATVVLLCALGGAAVYFVLQTQSAGPYRSVKVVEYTPASEVLITHALSGGAHSYSGLLPLPTECNSLSAGIAASAASSSTRVKVALVVLEPKLPCSQKGDAFDQDFTVSFVSGSEGVPEFDGVTINGMEVAYRLIEAN